MVSLDAVFYWTGALTWLALGLALAILVVFVLVGVIRGFFIACSLATFFSKCAQVDGPKPSTFRFLLKVLRVWGWAILFREGESVVRGPAGSWSGFGKYSINQVPAAERSKPMTITSMVGVQCGPRPFEIELTVSERQKSA